MATTIVETLGPFLIPIALFVLGLIGYLVLFALTRVGLLGED